MIRVKSKLGSLAKITNDFTGITRRKISKISQDRQENPVLFLSCEENLFGSPETLIVKSLIISSKVSIYNSSRDFGSIGGIKKSKSTNVLRKKKL